MAAWRDVDAAQGARRRWPASRPERVAQGLPMLLTAPTISLLVRSEVGTMPWHGAANGEDKDRLTSTASSRLLCGSGWPAGGPHHLRVQQPAVQVRPGDLRHLDAHPAPRPQQVRLAYGLVGNGVTLSMRQSSRTCRLPYRAQDCDECSSSTASWTSESCDCMLSCAAG